MQTSLNRSLLIELFQCWKYYQIPVHHYHYFLILLKKLSEEQKIKAIQQQMTSMKHHNHHYHLIKKAIFARQQSLIKIIPNIANFKLLFNEDNLKQEEFLKHLRLYRSTTMYVVLIIDEWQSNLLSLGYNQPIQPIYHDQDYLLKINNDIGDLIRNSDIFEDNPFLIMRDIYRNSEYSEIYRQLSCSKEQVEKIQQSLIILSAHQIKVMESISLGKYNMHRINRKIKVSNEIDLIYCNYNNNKKYLVLQDSEGKADIILKTKNQSHPIIVNPQFHPVLPKLLSHPVLLAQSQITNESTTNNPTVSIKKIKQKQSLIVDKLPSISTNRGTILENFFIRFHELHNTHDKKEHNLRKKKSPSTKYFEMKTQKDHKQGQYANSNQEQSQQDLSMQYEFDIDPKCVLKYLSERVMVRSSLNIRESVTVKILSSFREVSFMKIQRGNNRVAWVAAVFFIDSNFKRTVKIVYQFIFESNFNLIEFLAPQFVKLGYSVIKQQSQILYQTNPMFSIKYPLLCIKYIVNDTAEINLKEFLFGHQNLKQTRILKYYYYSSNSKYHYYCEHQKDSCSLSFYCEEIIQISIEGQKYLRVKINTIRQISPSVYLINSNVNQTNLLIGKSLLKVVQNQAEDNNQQLSSDESDLSDKEQSNQYSHICLKQKKIHNKYVDDHNHTIVNQIITINSHQTPINSIRQTKNDLSNCLIIDTPYQLAIIIPEQECLKSIALINID